MITARRYTNRFLLLLLVTILMVGSCTSALASPPAVDFGDSLLTDTRLMISEGEEVSEVEGTRTEVGYWQTYDAQFDFALPEPPATRAKAGDTMRFNLPVNLHLNAAHNTPMDLKMTLDDGTVVVFGTAYVRRDDAGDYIESVFNNKVEQYNFIKGTISAKAEHRTTEVGDLDFEFDKTTFYVKRDPKPPFNPDEEANKWGYHFRYTVDGVESDYFHWVARVHQGANVPDWSNVRIEDTLGPYQHIVKDPTTNTWFRVMHATNGVSDPNRTLVEGTDYTYTFTTQAGAAGPTGFVITVINPAILKQGEDGLEVRFFTKINVPLDQIPSEGPLGGIFNRVRGLYGASGETRWITARYRDILGSNIDGYAQADLIVTKVDDQQPPRVLTAPLVAKFELRRADNLELVNLEPVLSPPITLKDGNTTAVLTTNSAGITALKGLVNGVEYILTESEAPEGFVGFAGEERFTAVEKTIKRYTIPNRPKSVRVGDYVWIDSNRNGIQDDGEPGVQGAELRLTDHLGNAVTDVYGNPVNNVLTDADGRYSFEKLPPTVGDQRYVVHIVKGPDGHVPTTAGVGDDRSIDSSTGSATSIALPEDGDEDLTLDFGFVIQPTEPEIVKHINSTLSHLDIGNEQDYSYNITVTLPNTIELYTKFVITDTVDNRLSIQNAAITGAAADAFTVTVAGQTVTATVKAGSFASLQKYDSVELVITAQIRAGIADQLIPNQAGISFTNESGADKDKQSEPVTVSPRLYKLGDYVWYDDNRDGLQDATDRPVPNVTVTISGDNLPAGYVTTTKTDASGKYLFEGLPNGIYHIVFSDIPAGYVPTITGAGADIRIDSNGLTTSGEIKDADNLTLDLGIVTKPAVSVGDFVWIDSNYNGIQDAGEPLVKGAELKLTDLDGKPVVDVNGVTVPNAFTDASGLYLFENLPPTVGAQRYVVHIVRGPDGYVPTLPEVGADRAVDSSTGSATSTALPNDGDKDLTLDFGFVKLYKLGDYVWYDDNRDGIQDPTEKPVPGVTVTISGDNLPAGYVTTTKTNAKGEYIFENLPNGTYHIVFSDIPAGYVPTITGAGADTSVDSNGLNTTGEIKDADNLTLDLGIVTKPTPTAAPRPTPAPTEPRPPEPQYPTLYVPLSVQKVLKNGSLQAGSFTFQLKDSTGKVLATVSNHADGTVVFPDRSFSRVTSNYKYTIHEVAGSDDRIIYDNTVYTVLISTRAVNGKLEATVNVLRDGTPFAGQMVFTNQRKAPPTGDGITHQLALLLAGATLLAMAGYALKRRPGVSR